MDSSIVIVILLAVVSLVGSLAKKAQSKIEEDKQKEAAEKRAKKVQAFGEAKSKQQQARAAGGMSSFGGAGERQETMRPFGGAASQSDPSMQPQQMSTAFQGDSPAARRIVPGATMDERDASERESESSQISLQLDRDSLLQGIVLAEVLKRPKPGSFRRMPANR